MPNSYSDRYFNNNEKRRLDRLKSKPLNDRRDKKEDQIHAEVKQRHWDELISRLSAKISKAIQEAQN